MKKASNGTTSVDVPYFLQRAFFGVDRPRRPCQKSVMTSSTSRPTIPASSLTEHEAFDVGIEYHRTGALPSFDKFLHRML